MTIAEYNNCVNSHADALFRFIVKNLKNEVDAQDVIQNAYEKLWVHRGNVEPISAKSYLFTIAYHKMIDFIRARKKTTYVADFNENFKTSSFNENFDTKKILDNAFDTLNEMQRMLIMLKDYEGYSYAEIGQIADLNESQVKVYLHRARISMKQYLISVETVI
jgi:RNA polymerase sigma factor (sigma-70 family)